MLFSAHTVRFHSKLAVLLIAVVLVSGAQCLASCTIGDSVIGIPAHSSEDVPPCHHHQKTPAGQNAPLSCHYFVLPGTSASLFAQVVLASPLIATPPVSASALAQFVAIAEDLETNASPPLLSTILSSTVLRI